MTCASGADDVFLNPVQKTSFSDDRQHLLPADTPRLAEVAIDGRILAFTAAISLGSGLLFGLLPA